MYKLLESRIKSAEQLKDPIHTRRAILGIYRIAMQHACISLGEWIISALQNEKDKSELYTNVDTALYLQPADGSLIKLLTQLMVSAENIGWKSAGRTFWNQSVLPNELRKLTGSSKANIEKILLSFVNNRNDSVEGHGLADEDDPRTDILVLKYLLTSIEHILPIISKDDGELYIPAGGGRISGKIKTVRLYNGNPICYRKLKRISAGKLSVEAQIQKTLLNREDVTFEVDNILLDLPAPSIPEYDIYEPTWTDDWRPFIHIPERLASQTVFTGRKTELLSLCEWADDSDSRKCMVWGDGGVGKTTLVIEFLHRYLEGKLDISWRPEIITFYTAKKTRWGLQGLEQISAQDIGVADVALDIARMLTNPKLDRSWFDKNPKEIIQKLAGLMADMGVNRDSHLIVLDNTETMAKNDADVQALASQINELSRRVGRVILTSRRREHIEALPIQTENWNDDEGSEFMKKRAEILECRSINQAGLSTLKKYSRLLINKPIALEVFVQAAATPGTSLDSAFQRVQRMQRQDLGHFLYDDAWLRLSPALRRVLLLMSRLGDTHDQYLMQLCCQRTDVTVSAASEAIEESRGIASITRFEGTLQITFSPEFYNYCIERYEVIDGHNTPTEEDKEWVRRRYQEFIASTNTKVHDRHMKAFVVPAARAAWKNFNEGNYPKAIECYELAELEDPENGWLFDRYAYALMKDKKLEPALKKAEKAIQLINNEAEFHFTKGMIESRSGLESAILSLDKAAELGKPKHLCELQKAYFFIYTKPQRCADAKSCLENAKRNAPQDKFLDRFQSEITRFERRWLS